MRTREVCEHRRSRDVRRCGKLATACLAMCLLGACASQSTLPSDIGSGAAPLLPAPHSSIIPTVNVAPAKGWPSGGKPTAAPGLAVDAFATDLQHPRWVYMLPNGDVLVAETDAPPKPE